MRRVVTRPVAPEHRHIKVGIGAAHEGADVGKATVNVTLGGEQAVDIERAWQRARLWLQCLGHLLRLARVQPSDDLRERLVLREWDESFDELLGAIDICGLVRPDARDLLVATFLRRLPDPSLSVLIISLSVQSTQALQHRRPRRELGEEAMRRDIDARFDDLRAHADEAGIVFRQASILAPGVKVEESLLVARSVFATEPRCEEHFVIDR